LFWDYLKALLLNWRGIVLLVLGVIGIAERFSDKKITLPRWAKVAIIVSAFVFANFSAYREARLSAPSTEANINMVNDAANKSDESRTDFRFTLRNFGNATAVTRISYVFLLDGRPQDLAIQLPERTAVAPGQQVDINLPLSTTADTNAAIWAGQHQVEIKISADYSGGEPNLSKKYRYIGKFDAPTRRFDTIESE